MAKCLEQMMGDLSSQAPALSYSIGSSITKSWPCFLPQFPQQTLSFPVQHRLYHLVIGRKL